MKNKLKEYLDVIAFVVFLFIIQAVLKVNTDIPLFQKKSLLLSIVNIALISSFILFFKQKTRKIFETIIIIIFSFYCFAQNYHYLFFEVFFSFNKLSIVGELIGVVKEVIAKFDVQLILYPIVIVLWIVLSKKIKNNEEKKKYIINTVLTIVIVIGYIFTYSYLFKIPEGIDEASKIQTEGYLYETMSNKNRFMNRFGTFTFIKRDIEIQIERNNSSLSDEDKEKIENYINNKQVITNEYTGVLEGKNIIFILAESLCPEAINEELTPTLYKMKSEGMNFENYYAPIYPSATNDQEFVTQTSLMPSINGGTTSYTYQYNYYPYSLPNMLKNQGYNVNSYHSFIKSFYNREPFHEALGFSHFYARDDMNIFLGEGFVDYYNWTDDSILFEKMIEYTDTSENFYDFVITASGHLPYMDLRPELYENKDIAKEVLDVNDDVAYYYAAQMKLDQGLERLIELLKEKGIYENTVIILVGDHYPYGVGDETADYLFDNLTNDYDLFKTPFIIYGDGIPTVTVSNICSTFDVMPTISNMLGFNLDDVYYLGNDATENDDNVVYFADGSLLNKDFYYDATNSILNKYSEDEETINKTIADSNEVYKISQKFLEYDYYSKTEK